jgi:hypothetical protein
MDPRVPLRAAVALVCALFFLSPEIARATTKQECIAASEKGQELAVDHKLLLAREQFLVCARDECPKAIRIDCSQQFAKVERSIATVVISARRAGGAPVIAASVRVDDGPPSALDGSAIRVDPGRRDFEVTKQDGGAVMAAVVSEGASLQSVEAIFPIRPSVLRRRLRPRSSGHHRRRSRRTDPTAHRDDGRESRRVRRLRRLRHPALRQSSDYHDHPGTIDNPTDSLKLKRTVADVFLGVGAATAIVATVPDRACASTPLLRRRRRSSRKREPDGPSRSERVCPALLAVLSWRAAAR